MSQCERCGEHNHDDARYCGTCGVAMPDHQGIESPVVDGSHPRTDAGTDEHTAPGLGPVGAGPRSSEYVGAPTFGETGPVTAPTAPIVPGPTNVRPPPTAVPPTGTPVSGMPTVSAPYGHTAAGTATSTPVIPTRSSRSASVMIATVAVAVVVIVGGVFVLLSSNSGGPEVARTGEESTAGAPVDTATPETAAPETATPDIQPTGTLASDTPPPDSSSVEPDPPGTLPTDTLPTDTLPTDTLPTDTVTLEPVEAEPVASPEVVVPPPTAPPVPAPTQPPTPSPTLPSRGPGDLGLSQPILDEACDGRYITFVGSAVGDRPYRSVVQDLLDVYPGANYIWTKACPSLRQTFSTGDDIYGVVFGPYGTQQEACNARAAGPADAYVRRISTFDPQDHTINC